MSPQQQTSIELWQAEWCPSSHRVRQRLTELGLSFTAHQVSADRDQRTELRAISGPGLIPVLRADGAIIAGAEAIITYLDAHFEEAADAAAHRARAEELAAGG